MCESREIGQVIRVCFESCGEAESRCSCYRREKEMEKGSRRHHYIFKKVYVQL